MVKEGYIVHLFDLSGFGRSGGKKFNSTFKNFHDDLKLILLQVNQDFPLFLFGHSMGCLVIATFLLNNPNTKVAGVIFNSGLLSRPQTVPHL